MLGNQDKKGPSHMRSPRHAPFPRGSAQSQSIERLFPLLHIHIACRRHAPNSLLTRTNATTLVAKPCNIHRKRLFGSRSIARARRNFENSRRSSNLSQCLFALFPHVYLHPRPRGGLPQQQLWPFTRAGPWQSDHCCPERFRDSPCSFPCPWVSSVPPESSPCSSQSAV